ncbi:hypothetical protein ASG40_11915 [Methylobacterium sp. Leaf399]|uniref:hypothetical protein n=1 Tax=Methylobacterium sp. Leaf399 TaxID=1736364 RepID=UPI000700F8D4|nr:hypothetical protein [Methylobacterium sp. Leaf399]KQT08574.1 hypothetical protein ASG40_11915 [Methylobacterium sp. Leaf399]
MSISPFTAGTYVSDRNAANLVSIKNRLDGLSTQLATQQTADSYGGLGSARTTSLSAHATLSALDGYDAAIAGATTRVNLATTSVTQVATLGDGVRASLAAAGTFGTGPSVDTATKIARSNLDAALDALNQQAAGRYLFGGRETDRPPVAASAAILDGDPVLGRDGLRDVIAERKAADGALSPGRGGLAVGSAGPGSVTLSEAATVAGDGGKAAADRANFGFFIGSVTSSRPAAIQATRTAAVAPTVTPSFSSQPKDGDLVRVSVNQPDGSQVLVDYTARTTPTPGTNEFAIGTSSGEAAANLSVSLSGKAVAAAQSGTPPGVDLAFSGGAPASVALSVSGTTRPVDGDTVTVALGMRDGTTTTITLTAKSTTSTGGSGQFRIDADPAVTAQNMQAALANALETSAATTLAASSSTIAAQDFFAGSKQTAFAPRRVDTANGGFVSEPATAAAKTVIWYTGDDTSADPRTTAAVQVDASRRVGIGAQANEAPIRAVLAGIAALAAERFTDTSAGTPDNARYQALAERSRTVLASDRAAGSIESIASDLSLAARNMQDAKAENGATRAVLQDTLDGLDTVDVNEVTAKLLALQTQLQASYQVTSTLSKLTLVNYMS